MHAASRAARLAENNAAVYRRHGYWRQRSAEGEVRGGKRHALPAAQVNQLEFGYGDAESLYKDVDFGLDLDSRVALVGPNGAGKSTLVKVILFELN